MNVSAYKMQRQKIMEVLYGGKSKTTFKFSLIMLLSLSFTLAGCGGNNNTKNNAKAEETGGAQTTAAATTGDKAEPFNISIFLGEAGQQPTPDNKIYKKIKEETGASFNFEFWRATSTRSWVL